MHVWQVYRTVQPDVKRQATAAAAFPGDPSLQPPQAAVNSESPVSEPSLAGPGAQLHLLLPAAVCLSVCWSVCLSGCLSVCLNLHALLVCLAAAYGPVC